MSNELNLRVTFTHTKNGAVAQRNIQKLIDVAADPLVQEVQSIGTTDTVIDLGGIGTIGYVFFHNLDPTNYIVIGSDGTLYPLKLKPLEFGMARWNAAAMHAKANTAACLLETVLLSD